MSKEIERRFLVPNLKNVPVGTVWKIEQCLINEDPLTRIRLIDGNRAVMTFKGYGEKNEFDIPFDKAVRLIEIWGEEGIAKNRTRLGRGDLNDGSKSSGVWEVDEFLNDELKGLCIAEIEFSSLEESERLVIPAWCGQEVTDDPRWANVQLAKNGWPDDE